MIEIGNRRRPQPAPPHVVFEALTQPNRDPFRPWLSLLDDEVMPSTIEAEPPHLLVWSSLWKRRPDARVTFELPPDGGQGTNLRWILRVDEPAPDEALAGHLRRRMNVLINANLRFTFGQ